MQSYVCTNAHPLPVVRVVVVMIVVMMKATLPSAVAPSARAAKAGAWNLCADAGAEDMVPQTR